MESLKLWLLNVGIKKMGPSLIKTAVAFAIGIVAAHQQMLATFGVIYDSTAHTITLHIDTLQTWILGGGLGIITAFLTATQHHTEAAITGQPQDGSHERKTDVMPGVGQ